LTPTLSDPASRGGTERPVDAAAVARAVVLDYLNAFGAGDFARMESLLHGSSFSYIGPTVSFSDAATFITDFGRLATILKRVELRKLFQDGEELCAIHDFFSTLPGLERVRLATWFRVVDGRISMIENFFDVHPYMRMFGETPVGPRP
jgi:hypothetical protein